MCCKRLVEEQATAYKQVHVYSTYFYPPAPLVLDLPALFLQ